MTENTDWSRNIIIADADYIDRVAFHLTVNFERMIGRQIPPADLPLWLDCIALDGGVREGDNDIQVILVHDKPTTSFANFSPASFAQIDGKAFRDHLGEFTIACLPVEEIVSKTQFINDILGAAVVQDKVERIMVIPNSEDGQTYQRLRSSLQHTDDEKKRITLFAMQPMPAGRYRQEILGYSLMAALGIKSQEINPEAT